MINKSYWESVLYDVSYDLIVVGGGLTGQSTAYFFKKNNPSAKVLVVERGFFPIGASTRNAGFACIGTIGEHIADLEIDTEESLKDRIKSRYDGLLLLRETLGDEAIEYDESGGHELFVNKIEFDKVAPHIEKFNGWMEDIIGVKNWYEAVMYQGNPSIRIRKEGMLHPGKMMKRLCELNYTIGVEIRWNTPIKKVDIENNVVTVADDVQLHSHKLVLATNAFTQNLLPEKVIKPGRGYVFVTSEIDDLPWKGTFHFNKGYVYFRNLGEKRILIGGGRNVDYKTEETSEFGINSSIKEYLFNFVNDVLKLPQDWKIDQEWSGIMGFTDSKSPMVERINDNSLLIAGLSGMGVALGMQLGKKAANQL